MEISAVTPRDRLQNLVDIARKAVRYWYLLVVFAVVGAGLSFAFAITRPRVFQSWSTLFYEERISSTLLQGRAEEVQRNIGDRYRELLMAHSLLEQITSDPKLDPIRRSPPTTPTSRSTSSGSRSTSRPAARTRFASRSRTTTPSARSS